jgi:hypothetical protein
MRELECAKREAAALRREAEALRASLGSVQGAVEEALRAERARAAVADAAAQYARDQRALWLRSPEGALKVLTMVVENGHCAAKISWLSRAFRGDVVLWGCIKARTGAGLRERRV